MHAAHSPASPRPIGLNESVVLSKCDYFLDLALWPLRDTCDPRRWLSNFLASEQEHALYLLYAFQLFSETLTDQLFTAAFQALSLRIIDPTEPLLTGQTKWRQFLDRAIITPVEGEEANIGDSGFSFARRARQLVGLPQRNLLTNEAAITTLLAKGPTPIIFVDDLVGSGNQFATTWFRSRTLTSPRISTSFADVAAKGLGTFFYCPLFATLPGASYIRTTCPEVTLLPLHTLTARDSALTPNSHVWPAHLLPTALSFLESASARAGIADWKGFNDLGLTIAFRHCVPDATLPLYHWRQNGWIPLVTRT